MQTTVTPPLSSAAVASKRLKLEVPIAATEHTIPMVLQPKATWKDSERIAQFVANVTSAVLVVAIASYYLVPMATLALVETPRLAAQLQDRAACIARNASIVLTDGWKAMQKLDIKPSSSIISILERMWNSPQVTAALTLTITCLVLIRKYKVIGWFLYLQAGVTLQWGIALYQLARILFSMSCYFTVKLIKIVLALLRRGYASIFGVRNRQAVALRQLMKTAPTHAVWVEMAEYLDTLEGKDHWKTTISDEDLEYCDFVQLRKNLTALKRAMDDQKPNMSELRYMMAACVMRNELGVDSPSLHLECKSGTKTVINEYNDAIVRALEMLGNASDVEFPREEKIQFFKHIKQSFGSTALCLSGGGSIAMYHKGIIKALLEADVMPNIVSGSSGGAITAAMIACKTNKELLDDIIQDDVSTRFIPLGIRWFPPLLEQITHCIKTGFLVECSTFERTTQHYYGEPLNAVQKSMYYTFQDAFLKTGRHVCITVSASDVNSAHKGPKKLLLDHINSPHVLLWSAVACSCSLPGIMKSKQLMARDFDGNVVPYNSLGKEWCDGSIQHDLPMETMASCFNVTNFIVSQVNPHVVPFVGDEIDQPGFRKSIFHTLESVIAADVRHRLKMLAFLGLFPKIYGHQFSAYFRQNFSGNVTLVPDFSFQEAIGIKAIQNPTKKDMHNYIEGGQRTAWPKLGYIRHLCSIEKSLDRQLHRLLGATAAPYSNWLHPDSTELKTD
ncbi:Patatin-like phospholipase domain-containing protein [Phytophthora citrophthora]|uniref:Patatin-like phospholipase domain-containing protein n=1 Tax=Phytophthora citrophthora TaxID=4793 RepID=A0AAD9GZ09_9STRA|nr:Patatin-like phospholipase domain-containing protein [Phytophthora citrophthora]